MKSPLGWSAMSVRNEFGIVYVSSWWWRQRLYGTMKINFIVLHMRFEVFTSVKTWILVFWAMMMCSLVSGYRLFWGMQVFHLWMVLFVHDIITLQATILIFCCSLQPFVWEDNDPFLFQDIPVAFRTFQSSIMIPVQRSVVTVGVNSFPFVKVSVLKSQCWKYRMEQG